MKFNSGKWLAWAIPVLFIIIIEICRYSPVWAEGYARQVYPVISAGLSAFSALFPFSLGDCCIVAACFWLLFYPFYAYKKKKGVKHTVLYLFRFLMWVYIWFYLAWGINYFRYSFYERTRLAKAAYSEEIFRQFLKEYIEGLNESYSLAGREKEWYLLPADSVSSGVYEGIIHGYRQIAGGYGLVFPEKLYLPKKMLWSEGMSKMGVTGYMGPFFSEFNLNRELLNAEFPFTYAHELAHRLGIANEAEANLYAACVTIGAVAPEEVCFSGYFSLLGYVMNNAGRFLPEEEYREVISQIHPDILSIYKGHLSYWRGKYTPLWGKVQHKVYNAYLKSNKVTTGTQNYSEVVSLLISLYSRGR